MDEQSTKRGRGRPPIGDAPQTWRAVSVDTATIAKAGAIGLGSSSANIRFAVEFATTNGGIEAAQKMRDAKATANKEAAIKRLEKKAAKALAVLAEVEAAKAGLAA